MLLVLGTRGPRHNARGGFGWILAKLPTATRAGLGRSRSPTARHAVQRASGHGIQPRPSSDDFRWPRSTRTSSDDRVNVPEGFPARNSAALEFPGIRWDTSADARAFTGQNLLLRETRPLPGSVRITKHSCFFGSTHAGLFFNRKRGRGQFLRGLLSLFLATQPLGWSNTRTVVTEVPVQTGELEFFF